MPEQQGQEQAQELRTGRRLVLKDGSILENAETGYSGGTLWCYVPQMSFADAAAIFMNPAKTGTITFEYGEMEDVYEGYTNCVIINANDPDQTSICLERENVG